MVNPMSRIFRVALALPTDFGHFRQIAIGLLHFFQEHPDWEIASTPGLPFSFNALNAHLLDWDAVIGYTKPPSRAEALYHLPKTLGKPFVNISNRFHLPDVPTVVSDDEQVGRLAAKHLLEQGYERFCYFDQSTAFGQLRAQGFLSILKAAGHSAHGLEWNVSPRQYRAPEQKLLATLAQLPTRTAIFAIEDSVGIHCLNLLRRLGRAVPADIGVLGVNNDTLSAEMFGHRLSSIELDGASIGYEAGQTLARLREGKSVPALQCLAPLGVRARHSTDLRRVAVPSVNHALEYMEAHLAEPITVDDLAAHAGVSRRLLEMRFREQFGCSPYAKLKALRLDHAKHLLQTTNLSIAIIAERCGYPQPGEFSKTFHTAVGLTPTRFRAQG